MKIAMIGHKRIPSREGGVEIVVEELSTRMAYLGHKVVAYNRKGNNVSDSSADKDKQNLKSYKGVKIVRVFTSENKKLNAFLYSFNATFLALFGGYDVIHYHAEGPCAMIPLAKLFGKRTVATIHGLDWQRAKWGGFATKYLLFGEKMAAKYADEVIVLSKNVQKYFKDTYNRDTHYIPNGVTIPEPINADIITKKYGLIGDDYILFLARLVPEKGLHYLIEAYSQIQTDKKLVIAGGSSHSNDYVDQIKAMATKDSRVIMIGFVQGQEMQELMSNCSMYILPSDIEGMPISLLEAMSYGKQCLVSDIDENLEIAQDFAISFRKSDITDLKIKLDETLKNNIMFYNKKLVKYVESRFNWNDVTKKTLELYEN